MEEKVETKGVEKLFGGRKGMVIHRNPQIVRRLWINRGEFF